MFLLLSGVLNAQTFGDIRFVTEDYPPYNMMVKNELKGISVDLLMKVGGLLKSNLKNDDISLFPWARSYKIALKEKNTCLFATTRSSSRENLFKWVGPIAPNRISVFALKQRGIKVKDVKDLMGYRIGVVRNDIGHQLAQKNGLMDTQAVTLNVSNMRKLKRGRIDVWIYDENVAKWQIKLNGYSSDEFEVVYVLEKSDLYYAFNKNTSDKIVKDFQKALDQLKTDGTHQKILNKYLK